MTIWGLCCSCLLFAQNPSLQQADSLFYIGEYKNAYERCEGIDPTTLHLHELHTLATIQIEYSATVDAEKTLTVLEEREAENAWTAYQNAQYHLLKARLLIDNTDALQQIKTAQKLHTPIDSLGLALLTLELAIYDIDYLVEEGKQLLAIYDIPDSLAKQHPSLYSHWLIRKGLFYQDCLGNYKKSEALFLESLAIARAHYGAEHPEVATVLENLGILYSYLGNYRKSESLYLESLAIARAHYGNEHPNVAMTIGNLANLYKNLGNYKKSESLYLESLAIDKAHYGNEHPDVAITIGNLAELYSYLGNYRKSESLYLESLAIDKAYYGNEHPEVALTLNNIGFTLLTQNNYTAALPYLEESLAIHRKQKESHSYITFTLESLSRCYFLLGAYDKTTPLIEEGLQLCEEFPEDPSCPLFINSRGLVAWRQGDILTAEKYLLEAVTIFKQRGQEKSTDSYSWFVQSLLAFYQDQRDPAALAQWTAYSNSLYRDYLREGVYFLSAQELSRLAQKLDKNIQHYWSVAPLLLQEATVPVGDYYDMALLQKGFVLATQLERQQAIAQADSSSQVLYQDWQDIRRNIATLHAEGSAEGEVYEALQSEAEQLEKQFSRSLGNLEVELPRWQAVQASLAEGEAAIELIHHDVYTPEASDSIQYIALLLEGGKAQPTYIPLFEEKELTARLGKSRRLDFVNELYTFEDRGVVPIKADNKSLEELIWRPIAKQLGQHIHTLHISSSGLLHRINLAAIPISEEETLADRYQINLVTSTRVLANEKESLSASTTQDAIVYGGIRYNPDSLSLANSTLDLEAAVAIRGQQNPWKYLKFTAKEGKSIATLLEDAKMDYEYRTAHEATEESIKALGISQPAPRVLHLATHGFFFADQATEEEKANNFEQATDPLLRSGLILSDANYAWQAGQALPNREDGILTAYEISQLPLHGTELVVLSACETGLGEIDSNEGVIGLQRAFKIAGARYLIMSLWQVPDFQTQELMTTFYSKWLEEDLDIPQAFQAAQKEMREKYMNPYFWAGFVLVE